MSRLFDGKQLRDQVLAELKDKVGLSHRKPILSVILIGDDPVSVNYVNLKRKLAESIGIEFQLFHFNSSVSPDEVLDKIENLNNDDRVDGIMVQIPVPVGFDRSRIIEAISPSKDVDGLRYCQGLSSDFIPPVVCAISKALEFSGVNMKEANVALIGYGFLVGKPLERYLDGYVKKLVIADASTEDLLSITKYADVIISATGSASLVKPNMVKEGVVLVDAGTSEVGGKMIGDIDPESYQKSSYHTPVPGGIGPVTVAYLLKNLVDRLN